MADLNPTPSQSKTPSSTKKPNPNPNPNPKSPNKPRTRPKSPMSSKSEYGGKRHVAGGLPREQEEEDTTVILAAVADFKARNGSTPTPATMKPMYEALKGKLHHGDITIDQLYNKFRTLKTRYHRAIDSGVGPTPADRAFFDLSVRAWGEPKRKNPHPTKRIEEEIMMNSSAKKRKVAAKEEEFDDADLKEGAADELKEEGGGDDFKYLTDQARKYWNMQGMSMADLELGLKFMDKSKAAVLEGKWRAFFQESMKVQSKYHDAQKDVLAALANVG